MATGTAPTLLRPSRAVLGRRGVPERIVLNVSDALAPCLEGVALADSVLSGVQRIALAAAAGSRMAVCNEANRLGHRATRARAELRAMAEFIEDPGGGDAA